MVNKIGKALFGNTFGIIGTIVLLFGIVALFFPAPVAYAILIIVAGILLIMIGTFVKR